MTPTGYLSEEFQALAIADKPTFEQLLEATKSYLKTHDDDCGGSLHIVLEDYNLSDSDIEHCMINAKINKDIEGVLLSRALLMFSMEERYKLMRIIDDLDPSFIFPTMDEFEPLF